MSDLTYIFVHGLSGWGSYDEKYKKKPYWGMSGGDLMQYLRRCGFICYAASVAPSGSAWDRACELYAQLAGTRTDYGTAHSAEYQHERFGPDFTGRPLIPVWNADTRIVLIGHSFGGAAIRLFGELLANGDPEEQKTENCSPFFAGGMGDRIHSIVTLAAPTNGTTAYDMSEDPSFDPSAVKVSPYHRFLSRLVSKHTSIQQDGRDVRDYASYDMHIDNARALNERIQTLPHVYYYAVPCSGTLAQPDGTHIPARNMEPLFFMRAKLMGAYTGTTRGGTVIDSSWRENDGLVNTISAMAPVYAPYRAIDPLHIEPGIWNIWPTVYGDHMYLQGGLMRKHDIRDFYIRLLRTIESTKK